MPRWHLAYSICVCGLIGGAAEAQEYAFKRFGAEAGLRGPQAVVFDGQGSLLVGTNQGVARFDGRSFVDVPLPWRHSVWRLERAADGAVWGLSSRPGLLRLEPGQEAQGVPIPAPLRERLREQVWFIRLRADGRGRAWLSGGDGTIYRWNGPEARTWTSLQVPGVTTLGDFFIRGDGTTGEIVFVAGARVGILQLDGDRVGALRWVARPGGGLVYVRPNPRALAWAGGVGGVFLIAPDGTSRRLSPPGERVWPHNQAEIDSSGRLLTLLEGRSMHLLRFDAAGTLELDAGPEQGLSGSLPVTFAFDPEGGFWLADRRWLISLEDEHSRRFPLPDASGEVVQSMAGDPAAGPFAVGTYKAVYRLAGDRFERVSPPGPRFILPFGLRASPTIQWIQWATSGTSGHTAAGRLPLNHRVLIHQSTADRYEVDRRGLWRTSRGRSVRVSTEILPGAIGSADPAGRLWVGGEVPRLEVVVGDSLGSDCRACISPSLRAAVDSVNARVSAGYVLTDHAGRVWVQGNTGGLGVIWPSAAGLWRWRIFHADDGLLGHVTAMSTSPDGRRLWLGSVNGVQGIELGEGSPRLETFAELDARDGLATDLVTAVSEDSDGYLWVATEAEFVDRVEWRALDRRAASPRVRIERVEVNGRSVRFASRPIRLRSGDGLTIALAARTYRQPLRVGLEYRLQGRDTAWSSLGTGRSLALAALPSGLRTLEVRAAREGRPPGPPIELALDVRPPFVLSGWFGALVLLAATVAWWGVSRVRSGRRQAAEAVRQKIAEDLHDEVGSGLTQVALHSEMIRRLAEGTAGDVSAAASRADITALAVRVGEQANALSGSMRDLVWAIRPEERSWEDLELRLKDAAVATLAPHGIEADLRGEVESAPATLPSEVCQNVLLFAKEALHNAVKHASPSRVEVRWKVSRRSIALHISDDGRGFDPATARRGVGLTSLRRRAEVLGGTFGLVSVPGEGARLLLDIPIGSGAR